MPLPDLSLERLRDAHRLVRSHIHRTPLFQSTTLSSTVGRPVYLKCENLQKTGAFKVRGALHRLMTLSPEEQARGVATISAGNHAQAVAWAGSITGVRSVVVMPEGASPTKARASRAYGAEVILHGTVGEAFAHVHRICDERGLTFVHPFDDVEVVTGHASCGLEILEQLPGVRTIVVPVGGGGLSSGIAAAVAATGSHVDVWGVEPHGAAAMSRSLADGRPVHLDHVESVADGLAPPMAGDLNHAILSEHARGVALVEDQEIIDAMARLLERTKLLVEPSGAAGLAALLAGRIPSRSGEAEDDGPVVVVLSGGNADLDRLGDILSRASTA